MTRYVFRDVVLGFKNSHKADAQVIGETIAGIAVERGGVIHLLVETWRGGHALR